MERQESSNIDRESIDRDPKFNSEIVDSPIVTSLTPDNTLPSGLRLRSQHGQFPEEATRTRTKETTKKNSVLLYMVLV